METREQIIARHPLYQFLVKKGLEFKKVGNEFVALCPFHREKSPSFHVNPEYNTFHCFGCNCGGSVIDFVMMQDRISVGEAMQLLAGENSKPYQAKPAARNESQFDPFADLAPETKVSLNATSEPAKASSIVATYDYVDENGKLIYQAVRMDPKDFRQRRPDGNGGWIWNLKNIQRVIYKLPKVLKASTVWIVEGEKDVENLITLGLTATTNVGGAGKWSDAYSMLLKGKQVVVCPDNDEAGEKHREMVMNSVGEYAKSVRLVKIPEQYKDVSDLIEAIGREKAIETLQGLFDAAVELVGGIQLPVRSIEETEHDYAEYAIQTKNGGVLDFGKWLPTLGRCIRPLVAGDFGVLIADTGVGKTALLQNLCIQSGLETLFFEMELTKPTIFERFAQLATGIKGPDIETIYQGGGRVEWRNDPRLNKIFICDRSKLTTEEIEKIIIKSELKIGAKPKLVVIDYIQLIKGKGASRYERFSDIAENLKVIAKATGTVIFAASQVSRKGDGDTHEIFLHDAKDSGSIENSAGLILGAWRDEKDSQIMILKVLKCTKGKPGARVPLLFEGEKMTIREKPKIDPED
jgi:5S rRNA maturation endonuclease (ribonuclease M5)